MDSEDEFFYQNFIDTSDESSDDDGDIMMVTATLIHQFNEDAQPGHVGSVIGQALALDRKRHKGHLQVWKDYFNPMKTTHPASVFHCCFRMSRPLFLRLLQRVRAYDTYFEARPDAICVYGFSSYQNCTTAIRMLAYGVAGDLVHKYLHMSESTCLEWMYRFCNEYLREPNFEDNDRLLKMNESRGFLGMLGCIDCMHWEWKNCPFS